MAKTVQATKPQGNVTFLTDFSELVDKEGRYLRNGLTDGVLIPNLQSDYDIYITEGFDPTKDKGKAENGNLSQAQVLILQSLDTGFLRNGFTVKKELFGLNTYSFGMGQNFSFSYIATPYINDGQLFTSYVHFLYKRQLSADGALRIKTKSFVLPDVTVYNKRLNKPEFVAKDCIFTLPQYSIDPKSNGFVVYQTTVSFTSYDEYLNTSASNNSSLSAKKKKEEPASRPKFSGI